MTIELLVSSLAFQYSQGGLAQVILMEKPSIQSTRHSIGAADRWFNDYAKGSSHPFNTALFSLHSVISAFRQSVWQEVCQIPYGETRTYGDIAAAIGRPLAARAVGTAIGKNPCMIARPCHRVIGSHGRIGGFAYGVEIKRLLLNHEGASISW